MFSGTQRPYRAEINDRNSTKNLKETALEALKNTE